MDYLVAFVSISCALITFFLGVYFLFKNITSSLNFNFCLYCWLLTMWSLLSYAFFVNHNNFLLYKFVAAFGGVCLLMITTWVLYIVKEKPNKLFLASLYAMCAFLLSIPIWDKWALQNFNFSGNSFTYDNGPTYYLYSIIVFMIVGYTFSILIKGLFSANGPQRKLITIVLTGMSVFVAADVAFGVILPSFHITPLIPYVNLGATFFVILSTIGLLKFLPVEMLSSKL